MPKNLSQIAKQKKIKYFLISFVDLFGVLRSKLVPAQAMWTEPFHLGWLVARRVQWGKRMGDRTECVCGNHGRTSAR